MINLCEYTVSTVSIRYHKTKHDHDLKIKSLRLKDYFTSIQNHQGCLKQIRHP